MKTGNIRYLREVDEASGEYNYYYPVDYDEEKAVSKFNELVKLIRASGAHVQLTASHQTQDASFFGVVNVVSQSLERVEIVVSNFGNLATLYFSSGKLSPEVSGVAGCLINTLGKCGYVYVDFKLLDTPYDGRLDGIDTWWHRFFDYI